MTRRGKRRDEVIIIIQPQPDTHMLDSPKNTKKLFRFCQEQVQVFGLDAIELVGSHDWYLGADSIILTAL